MFRKLALRVANWLLDHLAAQIILALTPAALSMLTVVVDLAVNLPPVLLITVPAIGWSSSILLLVMWFRDHSRRRIRRSLDVGKGLWSSSNAVLAAVLGRRGVPPSRDEIQAIILALLRRMCSVVAYSLPIDEKGATFLVLEGHDDGARFKLFAQFNHDDPKLPGEVAEHFFKDRCFAGQAVQLRRALFLDDSKRCPEDYTWHQDSVHHNFRGRAAVPVNHYLR
jgi:hypothetical protein